MNKSIIIKGVFESFDVSYQGKVLFINVHLNVYEDYSLIITREKHTKRNILDIKSSFNPILINDVVSENSVSRFEELAVKLFVS